MKSKLKPGVVYGDSYRTLLSHCKAENYALPAVNVVGTNTVNAVLEAAARNTSDVIIQLSNGGAQFLRRPGPARRQRRQDARRGLGRASHAPAG